RRGGLAGVADLGDLLARLDLLARDQVVVEHVAVDGDRAVLVLDPHPVAEAAGRAGFDDHAVGRRDDRGADRVGDVDAVVRGAPAGAEHGGQPTFGGLDHVRAHGLFARLAGGFGLALLARVGELLRAAELLGLGSRRGRRAGLV